MKIPKIISAELETLTKQGIANNLEIGGKHIKIFVSGKLAGVLPRGTLSNTDRRSELNIRSQIRRIARGINAPTQLQ